MKKTLMSLNLVMAIFAVGCSEGAFTPTNTTPAFNTGMNNPYLNNNSYNPYNNQYNNPSYVQPGFSMNYQQQLQMQQMYRNQATYSWNMNMNMPYYYYAPYTYRSCVVRRPYYVNCNQYVTYRRRCPTVVTSNTSTTTATNTSTDTSTSTSTTTAQTTPTPAETTAVLNAVVLGKDAQALYDRLAREEEVVEKGLFGPRKKERVGQNYKCSVDGREGKAKNYMCDLDIRVKDGLLMDQEEPGKAAAPETATSMYKGELVSIGLPGHTPETGMLIIGGDSAKELFKDLPGTATQGKVDEVNVASAEIKSAGQVKCYKVTNGSNTITECLIMINSETGAAINAQ